MIKFRRSNGVILAKHPRTGIEWSFHSEAKFLVWCMGYMCQGND